jgi:hypothetical protein
LAIKARRVVQRVAGKGLAWGCAIALTAVLVSCGAPSFSYVADSTANTYFKVPYGWQQVPQDQLCRIIKLVPAYGTCTGAYAVGYEPGRNPAATDLVDWHNSQPFVFVTVQQVPQAQSGTLTVNTLRDLVLPVTNTGLQSLAQQGYPITNFKALRDSMLTLKQGFVGVRETYQYTYQGGVVDTFDKIVLTNPAESHLYILLVHCTTTCFTQDTTAIDDVMSSFTVRS